MHASVAPRCINHTLGATVPHNIPSTVSTLRYEALELLNLYCRLQPENQISTSDELQPV